MKYNNYTAPVLIAVSVLFFTSCKKESPEIPNEQEVITTLIYTLTPLGGGAARTLEFRDLDGDGGNDPVLYTDSLDANSTYSGSLLLLNEQDVPADTTSNEIWDENTEHEFFFRTSGGLDLSVAYEDQDPDGNPVGLESRVTTGSPSSGKLTITLRHQPDKFAPGASEGDITNAGGETDIEVQFDVVVK
jgi:hypothetical protein